MFQTLGKSFNGESSTGIGLNLVMKLIERNDVSINITNNSDVGCDFVISNLEIASNKASLLLDLTKNILK
jgi:K+-sensing histidine kinase KdpD